jgi:hypothetical protein
MSTKLGSRLAQLANARKNAEEVQTISPEERSRIEAETTAANVSAIKLLLLPHVEEFNQSTDSSLHLVLEAALSCIRIKQNRASLLTLEITAQAAVVKRGSGAYSSEDYFTFGTNAHDRTMTFSNYSAEVAKPLDANQFAELVLMEALGLNQ